MNTDILENSLAVIKRPRSCILDICLRELEICSHKSLYMKVHSSFICNSQKLETIQMSFKKVKG